MNEVKDNFAFGLWLRFEGCGKVASGNFAEPGLRPLGDLEMFGCRFDSRPTARGPQP